MFDQHYDLAQKPFRLTPDPAFYFESRTHRKALSYLSYGLDEREGFIVVTGPAGTGKTILAAHLQGRMAAQEVTVGHIVTSALDDGQVLALVARSFGVDGGGDKVSALGAIERFLNRLAQKSGRALLIVDEAQNLSTGALEELRMLTNLQFDGRPLIQVILLGEDGFRSALAHSPALEQLRQRVIASHHLQAMEQDEIEAYVFHRLTRAGWRGRPVIDHTLWDGLHAASGGNPRKINQIMTRLLLLGSIEEADRLDGRMLADVLAELSQDACAHKDAEASGNAATHEMQGGDGCKSFARGEGEEGGPSETGDQPTTHEQTPAPPDSGLTDAHLEAIELAFAERDRHLSTLRDQLERVSRQQAEQPELAETVERRLDDLEAGLEEHERSLRHVLQMMIEYFESGTQAEPA